MKYIILIVIFSLTTGYFLYPVINPPQEKTQFEALLMKFLEGEAKRYADADTAEKKLKAADELYEKMMLIFLSQLSLKAPESKPVPKPFRDAEARHAIVYATSSLETKKESLEKKALTLPERILADQLTSKDVRTFASFGYLDATDARIKKLLGTFSGNLTLKTPSRTGSLEHISLSVSESTKLLVKDSYDNVSVNFSTATSKAFRGVPGDENLLLVSLPENDVFFDLRSYPLLVGKFYRGNLLEGNFTLKKETKENLSN